MATHVITISGDVQHVGLRTQIVGIGSGQNRGGFVYNESDDVVYVLADGEDVDEFIDAIRSAVENTRAEIDRIVWRTLDVDVNLPAFSRVRTDDLSDVSDKLDVGIEILDAIRETNESIKRDTERLGPIEADTERLAAIEEDTERLGSIEADTERLAAIEEDTERLGSIEADTGRLAAIEEDTKRLGSIEADTGRLAAIEEDTKRLGSIEADTGRLASIQADTERLAAIEQDTQRLAAIERHMEALVERQTEFLDAMDDRS